MAANPRRAEKRQISPYLNRVIASYLSDRELLENGRHISGVSAGVPQGSILGPILWNVLYDGVLRIKAPKGVQLVGYADDLAIVVMGKTREVVEAKANATLRLMEECLKEQKS